MCAVSFVLYVSLVWPVVFALCVLCVACCVYCVVLFCAVFVIVLVSVVRNFCGLRILVCCVCFVSLVCFV